MGKPPKTQMGITEQVATFLAESNRIEGYDLQKEMYMYIGQCVPINDAYVINGSIKAFNTISKYVENDIALLDEFMIRELHTNLMKGLLCDSYVGEYRKVPVRVGTSIPPMPASVPYLMDEWIEEFNKKDLTPIELHYKFEYIHPFIDGNGRMGRLLWALDLLQRGEEVHPMLDEFALHIDNFYESRSMYYNTLSNYSMKQKLKDVIK